MGYHYDLSLTCDRALIWGVDVEEWLETPEPRPQFIPPDICNVINIPLDHKIHVGLQILKMREQIITWYGDGYKEIMVHIGEQTGTLPEVHITRAREKSLFPGGKVPNHYMEPDEFDLSL